MQEIKCPNCGQVFQVDESGYAQIVQQVRDQEFAKELARREQEMEKRRENDLTIARMAQEKQHRAALTEKESELAEKDREIAALQSRLAGSETEKKLAVSEAVAQKEKASDDVLGKKNEELAAKDREIERVFCCDLLSVAMARAPEGCAWVTVIGNANAVAVATFSPAGFTTNTMRPYNSSVWLA